jgi:hypothetical protein
MTAYDDLISAIKSGRVNLDGYASSPGFIGHFESSGFQPRRQAAGMAVRAILDPRRPWVAIGNPHIFGSPKKTARKYNLPVQDIDGYLSPMLAHDWLRTYDHYSKVPAPAVLGGNNLDLVEKTCVALMDIGGVMGHFFLCHDDLIFYPHWEVGFGIIVLDDGARKKAEGLLGRLTDDKIWRVQMRATTAVVTVPK